jgi:GNAT superfamily N-acetyltransferase
MADATPVSLSAVVPLAPAHKVGAFVCGDAEIDHFLHDLAVAEQALGLSQVYVVADAANEIVAYFTLSPLAIRVEPALLERLRIGAAPYPAIGGFLLGRLGVATPLQRQGVGEALVMRAAQIAKREAKVVGGTFLAVDPKDDRLTTWYARQDFAALGPRTRRMVLPLRAVPE